MLIEVLVTSEQALNDRPGRAWVRKVLSEYPLDSVAHFYTRILHAMEITPNPVETALNILPTVAREDTVKAILEETKRIRSRARRPGIFTQFLLLNMLKEAICKCDGPPGSLNLRDQDLLFRAYLATHDHFQELLSVAGRRKEDQLKEDILRQVHMSLGDQLPLAIPRYWALWVAIPKRLGLAQQLAEFLPAGLPRPLSSFIIPLAGLWAFFGEQARSQGARPVALDESGWHPTVLSQIKALINEITLDVDAYRRQLGEEKANLRSGELWEYSIVTQSRSPLLRIGDTYFCISLALLANVFCDGLYHRMLTACGGDEVKVNEFTRIFGEIFHDYIHDLWQRVAGRSRTHKLTWGRDQDELGDGIVETPDGIIIYDAKSRRPTLQITRSGDVDAYFDDLDRGVLKGARQLDAAIRKLRSGGLANAPSGIDVNHIFPVVVTARHFPEVPFVYERIDRILGYEGLLRGNGVAPLLIIDAQTLEIMEGLGGNGNDVLTLLTSKAAIPERRSRTIDSFIFEERGSLPWPARMKAAFGKIGECAVGWLRSGDINEEAVDRALNLHA